MRLEGTVDGKAGSPPQALLLNVRTRTVDIIIKKKQLRWTLCVSGRTDPPPVSSDALQFNTLTPVQRLERLTQRCGEAKLFNPPPLIQIHTHTHVRGYTGRSELVMVPGEVFPIVGGLTSHKHVPVFQNLLFG